MPQTEHALDALRRSRYALLRSRRRDGTAVDTPIWFVLQGRTLFFRTKIGPKTKRLAARPEVTLTRAITAAASPIPSDSAGAPQFSPTMRRSGPTARCTNVTAGSGTSCRC